MNSIITILFISILVIITYGTTMYFDSLDIKKCTKEYILKPEKKEKKEPEQISLYNIDNLSYLDYF